MPDRPGMLYATLDVLYDWVYSFEFFDANLRFCTISFTISNHQLNDDVVKYIVDLSLKDEKYVRWKCPACIEICDENFSISICKSNGELWQICQSSNAKDDALCQLCAYQCDAFGFPGPCLRVAIEQSPLSETPMWCPFPNRGKNI